MSEINEIEHALSYIDSAEREVWVSVGNALKGELGSQGLDIWMRWSENAPNFNRKAALSVWKSLKRLVVPIGYVFKQAKEGGYVASAPPRVLSEHEKAERAAKQEALRMQEALAASKNAEEARLLSVDMWHRASSHGRSSYLARKQVLPESVRVLPDGTLLVPMLRYDLPKEAAFVGVQSIKKDGLKLFPKGVAKSGCACRLGEMHKRLIAVSEGYATAASVRLAFDYVVPVFAAFDAGNLLKVVQILRGVYPNVHILVCADNDLKTKNNPGVKAGLRALKLTKNSSIIYPIFPILDKKSTDFNDLHVTYGVDALKNQFFGVKEAFNLKLEANK